MHYPEHRLDYRLEIFFNRGGSDVCAIISFTCYLDFSSSTVEHNEQTLFLVTTSTHRVLFLIIINLNSLTEKPEAIGHLNSILSER